SQILLKAKYESYRRFSATVCQVKELRKQHVPKFIPMVRMTERFPQSRMACNSKTSEGTAKAA
ncbi:MAG: hypothetical protein ABI851_13400, partial [Saprospiraceae bacterium]